MLFKTGWGCVQRFQLTRYNIETGFGNHCIQYNSFCFYNLHLEHYFTFRAFSRRFYLEQLTISTFVRGRWIYRCCYIKDVHRTKCKALTITINNYTITINSLFWSPSSARYQMAQSKSGSRASSVRLSSLGSYCTTTNNLMLYTIRLCALPWSLTAL